MSNEELYKRYINGESMISLAKEVGITDGGLIYRFHRDGFVVKNRGHDTTLTVNHNYFSCIDSEVKAYLLGFFAADGCVYNHSKFKNSWYLELNVQDSDDYITKLFQSEISPEQHMYYSEKKIGKNQVRFRVASRQIAMDLISLGFPPRKTYEKICLPPIIPELLPHFIRGFFDGDGTVGLYKTARNYYVRAWKVTCNCVSFLEELQEVLPVPTFITHIKNKQACNLTTSDWRSLKLLYNYLYDNANYFLVRKKIKFEEAALTPSELTDIINSQPCND